MSGPDLLVVNWMNMYDGLFVLSPLKCNCSFTLQLFTLLCEVLCNCPQKGCHAKINVMLCVGSCATLLQHHWVFRHNFIQHVAKPLACYDCCCAGQVKDTRTCRSSNRCWLIWRCCLVCVFRFPLPKFNCNCHQSKVQHLVTSTHHLNIFESAASHFRNLLCKM